MNDQEYIRTHRPDRIIDSGGSASMFASGYSTELRIYALEDSEDEYIVENVFYEFYNGHPMEGGRMRRDIRSDIRHVNGQELKHLTR